MDATIVSIVVTVCNARSFTPFSLFRLKSYFVAELIVGTGLSPVLCFGVVETCLRQ